MTGIVAHVDRVFAGFLANMTDQTTCEAHIASVYGATCKEKATVSDIWSELQFCDEHYRLLRKGEL